jgi:hypothetical protein
VQSAIHVYTKHEIRRATPPPNSRPPECRTARIATPGPSSHPDSLAVRVTPLSARTARRGDRAAAAGIGGLFLCMHGTMHVYTILSTAGTVPRKAGPAARRPRPRAAALAARPGKGRRPARAPGRIAEYRKSARNGGGRDELPPPNPTDEGKSKPACTPPPLPVATNLQPPRTRPCAKSRPGR